MCVRSRDLGLTGVRPDAPERGGGAMAQNGTVATRKDRREPAALLRDPCMTDRVDAAVEHMEPPGPDPARDHPARESELDELPSRDDAVMTTGEGRELHIERVR